MKAAINDVAAIQPAVGGGAAVAAPAVGGLAPAIGAGGGGGCHPGGSGDGAAPAAPAAAPAIGAGAGGGSSGDGAAAAAEEPFPEAEIAAAMIADGFKQYHMAAPTAAALPAVGGHESPMEPAVPPPAPAPALAPVGGDDDSEVVASSSLPAVGNNTVPGASSSLPVVGGNQKLHGIMSDWDVNGMVSLLESISLDHLSKAFIENGLDGAFPPVLAGGVGRDWSYRIAVQENHGLRAGWAERSMSQPLAVVFLPAVGGFLPWRGQLWRRTPTLEGHSQGWLGTAHGHAWQHSSKRKNTVRWAYFANIGWPA